MRGGGECESSGCVTETVEQVGGVVFGCGLSSCRVASRRWLRWQELITEKGKRKKKKKKKKKNTKDPSDASECVVWAMDMCGCERRY